MISRTTKTFWRHFDALPADVRRQATRAYLYWREDQRHPSVHYKCVSEKHAVYSVRVGIHYRALGYREDINDETTLTWFWIGSHADYDKLLASL
ncbi:hypothetical protein [Rhodospirillum sp. A1_3_36]|uniref:ParE family toxin-like protein n=1 Tax=Rhodospirillum sp. A1_3_36 TaxID=3391666 RepID=UPI0039A63812